MGEFLQQIKRGLGFGIGICVSLALFGGMVLWAQTLNSFAAGDLISASQLNENFTALQTETAKKPPIGSIVAWHRDFVGTPSIPDGWVECNGQVLSDPSSPYDGLTLPDLNNQARFLRGTAGTSGSLEASAIQTHRHLADPHSHSTSMRHGDGAWGCCFKWYMFSTGNTVPTDPSDEYYTGNATVTMGDPVDAGGTALPTASETRPINMGVVWIMRVK